MASNDKRQSRERDAMDYLGGQVAQAADCSQHLGLHTSTGLFAFEFDFEEVCSTLNNSGGASTKPATLQNIVRLPPIRLRRTQLLYRLPSNAEHHLSCIRLKTGIEPQDNAVFAPVLVTNSWSDWSIRPRDHS
ncbi:hypothetical protein WG66_001713 [Moniliophthora roreri]|nr:hypothetical protein WG66_001713 [Moniliophthora roreri]